MKSRRLPLLLSFLLPLGVLVFLSSRLAGSAQADAGPALEESNAVGSWLSPYPFVKTRVRMLDEQVGLKVEPVQKGELLLTQVLVSADFRLQNTAALTESMQVVYPLGDLECPWIAGPGAWTIREHEIDAQKFSVAVDGVPVSTSQITTTSVIPSGFPEIGGLECRTRWKAFEVAFPPGKDVRIRVRYPMQPSGELSYPWDSFTYVLKTGAGWYGTIGQVDISLQLPYPASRANILRLPPGYQMRGDRVSWRWTNLEPRQNLQVVILSLQSWQELEENRRRLAADPRDARLWYDLARSLESLAGRYDYNATCGLGMVGSFPFAHIRQWDYARRAEQAYRRAVALRPEWLEPQEGLAVLLASMSLSGNQARIQLDYPSARSAMREFERALAIAGRDTSDSNSQAQQALDEFKRCAVETCQCGY